MLSFFMDLLYDVGVIVFVNLTKSISYTIQILRKSSYAVNKVFK